MCLCNNDISRVVGLQAHQVQLALIETATERELAEQDAKAARQVAGLEKQLREARDRHVGLGDDLRELELEKAELLDRVAEHETVLETISSGTAQAVELRHREDAQHRVGTRSVRQARVLVDQLASHHLDHSDMVQSIMSSMEALKTPGSSPRRGGGKLGGSGSLWRAGSSSPRKMSAVD